MKKDMLRVNKEKHLTTKLGKNKQVYYKDNILTVGSREHDVSNLKYVIRRGRVVNGVEAVSSGRYSNSFAYLSSTRYRARKLFQAYSKYLNFKRLNLGRFGYLLIKPGTTLDIQHHPLNDEFYMIYLIDNSVIDNIELSFREYKKLLSSAAKENVCIYTNFKCKLYDKYLGSIQKTNPEGFLLGELARI